MGEFTARVIEAKCSGFGACARAAPDVFSVSLELVAEMDPAASVGDEALLRAAKSCPYNAIVVVAKSGEQIHPPLARRGD